MGWLTQTVCFLRQAWAFLDLKTLLVLAGAGWAFYKLVQRGGLHPLLDLDVSGDFVLTENGEYLRCSMEVKNVHLPMVLVEYAGLRVSSATPGNDATLPVIWGAARFFPVFDGHEKIWSGEAIRDKILLVPPGGSNFYRLEFRIGRKYRWYQLWYRWFTGRSSWYAVAIVQRDSQQGMAAHEDRNQS